MKWCRFLRKNNDEIHREPGVSRRRFFNIGLTFIGKNRFWSDLFRSRFVKSLENTSVFPAALPFARTKNLCFKTARTLKQLIFCLLKMKNRSNTLRVWRFWSEGRRKISYFKAVFPYGGQPGRLGQDLSSLDLVWHPRSPLPSACSVTTADVGNEPKAFARSYLVSAEMKLPPHFVTEHRQLNDFRCR